MIDPPPCSAMCRAGIAGTRHHAEHVDPHDAVELREVLVEQALLQRAGPSGIVDHDVQAAELLDRRIDESADLGLVADVGVVEDAHRGLARPPAPHRVRPARRRSPPWRPLRRIVDDAPADAGRTACDDRNLAGQFSAHDVDVPSRKSSSRSLTTSGSFELRAVACGVDDRRAGVGDPTGDVGGPARQAAVCRPHPRSPGSAP